MRIVALVPNSGARDARVVKEARTLAGAGHEVHIVGVRERDHPSIAAIIEDNVFVHRVSWQADAYRRAFVRLMLWMIFLGLAALIPALIILSLMAPALAWIATAAGFVWGQLVGWTEPFGRLLDGGWDWVTIRAAIWRVVLVGLVIGAAFAALIALRAVIKRVVRVVLAPLQSLARFSLNYAELERSQVANVSVMSALASGNVFKWVYGGVIQKPIDRILFKATQRARNNALIEKAESLEPDLIYAHEVMTLSAGVTLRNRLKKPLVYDAHEMYDGLNQADAHVSRLYSSIHAKCLGEVDQMVVVSEAMAEAYAEVYEDDMPPVTVIANAVNAVDLPAYDGRLHKAAGLPLDRKILLYQGGFSPDRGIEKLVEAAVDLDEDWSLVLMGWGTLQDQLEARVRQISEEWAKKAREKMIARARAERRDERQELVASYVDSFSPTGDINQFEEKLSSVWEFVHSDAERSAMLTDATTNGAAGQSPVSVTVNQGREGREGQDAQVYPMETKSRAEVFGEFVDDARDVFGSWAGRSERMRASLDAAIRAQMINELRVPEPEDFDKIRFVKPAPQEELLLWSQGATIGVIPYPNDGINHWVCSPNKLWEYAAANVPVLVTPVKQLYQFVTKFGFGWVLPPDPAPKRIAWAVNTLSEDDYKSHASQTVKFLEKHRWDIYGEKLVAVVEQAASKK